MRLILLLIGFSLSSYSLWADETDTIIGKQVLLKEVFVNSFKQDQNVTMAPMSASAVNGTVMRNRNITTIKEFSSFIPNLFIPDYGSKLTSPVYIRGIGSKINSPSVGLYVDGIPYFEKSAFDFDFSEIERVEILRGPQGTLYGRNTMGGLINVYTKSPLTHQKTTINLSAANYNNVGGSVSHYGKIGEAFGVAVSGNYAHAGGYFTNRYNGDKVDESDAGSGRIRMEWQLKPRLLVQLMSTFDYSDQGGYPYALVDPETQTAGKVDYNDYSSYRRTISTTGATVEYKADNFSIYSQTAFQYLTDKQGIDQDFSPKSTYFVTQDQQQRMLSQEFTIKSTSQGAYQWLFGTFGFFQGVDNEVVMDYKELNYDTQKKYDTPTYGVALYHQSTYNNLFTDGLSLTLGVRYDYEKASMDYIAYERRTNETKETAAFDSKLSFNQLTPKATLHYMLASKQLFYTSVTRGYKTGGFNTSFVTEEERSFRPEYSWNYELGTKLNWLDGKIKAELCLFYIDWKNQQIYQPLSNQKGSLLSNAGRSQSKGIEVALQANPLNGLMLQASYGYTDATFKEYKRSETLDYAGKNLPMVPAQTMAIGADYTIASFLKVVDRLTVSVNYTGTGKLYWNENNLISQSFYGQLNGKIAATKGAVTLSVWAKNITNRDYTAFYFETSGKGYAQKGSPFTIGTNIAVCF